MLLETNLGPFAPAVGYVAAIIASVYAIWTLIWKNKVWDTPQKIIPSTIRGLLGIILGVGMVITWLTTNPDTISSTIDLAIIFVTVAVLSFIIYYALLRVLTYDKEIATNPTATNVVNIIGGLWLRKEAKNIMAQNNITTQELFKGALYNADKLWTRTSQELAKSIIVILYILIVTCGTLGLTISGFIVQVRLTNKAAYEVIDQSSSPGLNKQ